MSRRRARAALLIASVVISLALAEGAVRLLLPRPGFEPIPASPSIIPDPIRGYAYAPSYGQFTNSFGMRELPIAAGETVHILAVGDSFTVGGGLKREEAWPAQLQTQINASSAVPFRVRVVNGAVTAYSLTQIRLLTASLLDPLHPQLIVAGLFTSRYWRVDDPYAYFHGVAVRTSDMPYLKPVEGGYIETVFATHWLQSLDYFLADHFYLADHVLRQVHRVFGRIRRGDGQGPTSAADVETRLAPFLKELAGMHDLAAAANVPLVALLINEQQPDGSFASIEYDYNRVVTEFCKTLGVTVVDPLPALAKLSKLSTLSTLSTLSEGKPIFRLGDDHHWSAPAHRVAAVALLHGLTEAGLLARLRQP